MSTKLIVSFMLFDKLLKAENNFVYFIILVKDF